MKHILLLIVLITAACTQSKKESNDQSADTSLGTELQNATNTMSSFGDLITDEDATDVALIPQLMASKDSLEIKLIGKIDKTCKMKGCWMTVRTGDETMRVEFKDYGFFVPKEGVEDKTTIFEGKLSKTITSVDALRHFAQDEGKSAEEIAAITEPKEEYKFVASGVLIRD